MNASEVTDAQVIRCMMQNGGGFVRALGNAAAHADAENLQIIKRAFKLYWTGYAEIAAELASKPEGAPKW